MRPAIIAAVAAAAALALLSRSANAGRLLRNDWLWDYATWDGSEPAEPADPQDIQPGQIVMAEPFEPETGAFTDYEIPEGQESFGDDYGYDYFADAQVPQDDPPTFFLPVSTAPTTAIVDFNAGSDEANLEAFLSMIREFESRQQYNVIYGGRTFFDMSKHPNIKTPIRIRGYENMYSTAAGAYQFLYRTWANLAKRLGLTDFSPESQDRAAVELLREVGALPAILAGDFDTAMRKAAPQWASLPYSSAKQNPKSIQVANAYLAKYMGRLA